MTATASFTARVTYANWADRALDTLSFTGTKAQCERWLAVKSFAAEGNEVRTELVENTLAQLLADDKAQAADDERQAVKRALVHHSRFVHPEYH